MSNTAGTAKAAAAPASGGGGGGAAPAAKLTQMQRSRQQRRASLKASLHLQTLHLQRGSMLGMTPAQKAAAMAAKAQADEAAAAAKAKKQPRESSGGGGGDGAAETKIRKKPSRQNSGRAVAARVSNPTELLRGEYSEQMLPHIAANSFKYVGGQHWFLLRRTKQFYNWQTRVTLNSLPAEIQRHTGGVANLPDDILRLEILRRDKERLHVAMQVNRAIDLLMDKLDNDDFAAAVFTKEAELRSEHRRVCMYFL